MSSRIFCFSVYRKHFLSSIQSRFSCYTINIVLLHSNLRTRFSNALVFHIRSRFWINRLINNRPRVQPVFYTSARYITEVKVRIPSERRISRDLLLEPKHWLDAKVYQRQFHARRDRQAYHSRHVDGSTCSPKEFREEFPGKKKAEERMGPNDASINPT